MIQSYAQNASDSPVFDAQFWYTRPDGLSGLDGPDDLGLIMPGPVLHNGRQMPEAEAREHAILTFRDAAGIRWIRMPDGALSEQTRATTRESVQAALEPSLPTRYQRLDNQITGTVVDAIVIYPRSRGELRLSREYDFVTFVTPPGYEFIISSEDGSTHGVRSRGPLIRLDDDLNIWDVWNHGKAAYSPASSCVATPSRNRQATRTDKQNRTPRSHSREPPCKPG